MNSKVQVFQKGKNTNSNNVFQSLKIQHFVFSQWITRMFCEVPYSQRGFCYIFLKKKNRSFAGFLCNIKENLNTYEHPQNTRVGPQMWKQRLREGKCFTKAWLDSDDTWTTTRSPVSQVSDGPAQLDHPDSHSFAHQEPSAQGCQINSTHSTPQSYAWGRHHWSVIVFFSAETRCSLTCLLSAVPIH